MSKSNLEITVIPDNVEDQNLEEKVIQILDKIDVNASSKDMEASQRKGKSKSFSKTTIVRFADRKQAEKSLSKEKV